MLLFAYLLRLNSEWDDAGLVVSSSVGTKEEREQMAAGLAKLIPEARIQADTEIIIRSSDDSVAEVIHKHSRDADAVFFGLMDPSPGAETEYAERLNELAEGFRATTSLIMPASSLVVLV